MKQALKAAGTAALGIAIAAVGAGTASADAPAPGGVGLPTTALSNPAVTGAVTDTATKLPGGDKVTGTLGTLAPSAGQAAPAAPEGPIAGVTQQRAAVPSIPGVDKTPLGGLTNTLPLPGLGG
ncbi:ATP-binding protein [Kitasatospora aureofaciens]|uniref:ATP-binding protein n=1 Tax=Kitasatospora aureofaciens TaxID=1894 RepID=UPI001C478FDC|nr:ATP-binding protein [Kitasatospora aureofaciens]MBV6696553.1 ATP-binding protein [Kitasatospora aureofaciens]